MIRNSIKSSRWRQAPALVISLVALFAALSGAALALPGKETVNSGDIKNNTVKSVDLKDGKAVASTDVVDDSLLSEDVQDETLTGQDIKDGSVASSDVATDTLQANDLAPDSVGSSELQNNSVGAAQIGDKIHLHTNSVSVAGGTAENGVYNFGTRTATCGANEELISGGGYWTGDSANDELTIAEVFPNHGAESVTVRGGNDSGSNATLVAYAECMSS